jgi:hypothetical protein
MAQLEGLFTSMGIYIGRDRSLRLQVTKVWSPIKCTYEERLIENKKEHVALTWAKVGYRGDVIWSKDGEVYSTCCGDICINGAGCTRSYNHCHKGKQTAFVVSSRTTGKSLALVVSNVSPCHIYLSFCHSLSTVHTNIDFMYTDLLLQMQ